MNISETNLLIARIIYSGFTLYMILIILRWLGPWLQLDMFSGKLAWIPRLTDPLISRIRSFLPPMGPFDFAPVAALLLVWLVRVIVIDLVLSAGQPTG